MSFIHPLPKKHYHSHFLPKVICKGDHELPDLFAPPLAQVVHGLALCDLSVVDSDKG
jgi:hypothetical protein